MEKKNKKAYFYTGRILLFFLFFLLAARPTQAAFDPTILCPDSGTTPTEILVYYHGLLQGTNTGYTYNTNAGSLRVFEMEFDQIKAVRPGIVGVHINTTNNAGTEGCASYSSGIGCIYVGNNISSILTKINTTCGITNASSLPLSLAGHSNGGSPINAVKSSATGKVIFLDAMYGPYANGISCDKLRIVGGDTTNPNNSYSTYSTQTETRCKDETGFTFIKNNPQTQNHYQTIDNLSSFYLDTPAGAGGTAGATTTKTKKPFELLNPLLDLQVNIPGIEKLASETPAACTTSDDNITTCSLPWISIYIKAIYNYSMSIVGILAAFVIMIGGVIYLTSTGNANRIKSAQSWITGGLTGLLIMFTSYVLLNEINPDLIRSKPIELSIVRDEFVQDPNDINLGDLPVGSGAGSGEILNDGVPFFNQCNASWRDFPYDGKAPNQCGGGDPGYSVDGTPVKGNTLCASSCGVNSAAMVLKYYGYGVTPPLLANWLVDNNYRGTKGTCQGTSFQGIQDVIKNYGPDIKSEYVSTSNYVAALQAGKKIIYLMRGPCPLKKSKGGHYVVLTGIKTGSNNSTVNINDPFRGQRKQASTSDINTCWAGGMAFYQ